ncbi:MAG: cobyric acid synthase [Muribaculum sp.]|nr:cobyric acid synthase [Muribaculum sp.]
MCRIFRQDGYNPAPFKAQNMALNSFVTPDGLEIGRAQAVQAEAAGIECRIEMNPLLLKPNSDHTSQVVLLGRPHGNRSAYSYFRSEGREELRAVVNNAFDRLAAEFNPIVLEGAGSISEINLADSDLVNMSMARHAGADVILVADIDRGGVFASVYGSVMLQSPDDRARIKGIIVNKFRGDIRLFESGVAMMEKITGVPVLGVVPYSREFIIDPEDSVMLETKNTHPVDGMFNVCVVRLAHISNFTDFDRLERTPGVNLYYTDRQELIRRADAILIPGTKSTIADLADMREKGLDTAVVACAEAGVPVWGICGGYQIMGRTISDPDGIEGTPASVDGLGLLPTDTVLTAEKRTCRATFRLDGSDAVCEGYEIHMGRTTRGDGRPVAILPDGRSEGCRIDWKIVGSYMHGMLDNSELIDRLHESARRPLPPPAPSQSEFKSQQYDKLADHLRRHIDIERLYAIMKGGDA